MTKKKALQTTANMSDHFAPQTANYIVSITLENVRCFGSEPQTLSLLGENGNVAQWTVILGENGTGKTTLLRCLAASDRLGNETKRPRGLSFPSPDKQMSVRIVFADELDLSLKLISKLPTERHNSFGRQASSEFYAVWVPPFVNGYGAQRQMTSSKNEALSEEDPSATLFDESKHLGNAESWLLEADYAAAKERSRDNKFKRHRDHVIEVLKRILPGVRDIRINAPKDIGQKATVEFLNEDGWIPLSDIGYGYRSFVAWIVDLASRMMERYPHAKDPLAEPAVVLVDEIDLHLHPTWQRKLMAYLSERFPKTQFIVTAHSPVFVHAASNANLVLLRRDQKLGHVVIANSPHVIRNWRIDQLLTSDLFGLETTRPPELEPLLDERRQLMSKAKPTAKDKKRLKELSDQIGDLPAGDSVAEIDRAKRLDRALDLLEQKLGVRA